MAKVKATAPGAAKACLPRQLGLCCLPISRGNASAPPAQPTRRLRLRGPPPLRSWPIAFWARDFFLRALHQLDEIRVSRRSAASRPPELLSGARCRSLIRPKGFRYRLCVTLPWSARVDSRHAPIPIAPRSRGARGETH